MSEKADANEIPQRIHALIAEVQEMAIVDKEWLLWRLEALLTGEDTLDDE